MEREYTDENPIPVRHPFAVLNESDLSKMSFRAGDAVVLYALGTGVGLSPEHREQIRLRISDEVEKELRRIRRGE